MALKFLNKKGWHTGSLRNIENVWKAEQKHEAEQKKLEELRKQILEERERSEFRLLQEQAGLVPKQERLEFLYDSGLAVGKGSSSSGGFKALESSVPPPPKADDASTSSSTKLQQPGALFEEKQHSSNDAWRKLHSDPLLLIRQREQEALSRVKNNPVQMAMIRKSVEATKSKKKMHDGDAPRRKHHHKKKHDKQSSSKYHSDSDTHTSKERRKSSGRKGTYNTLPSSEEELSGGGIEGRSSSHKSYKYKEGRSCALPEPITKNNAACQDVKDTRYRGRDGETHSESVSRREEKERQICEDDEFDGGRRFPVKREAKPLNMHRKRNPVKLSEEERRARLREMQMDAEMHEEQRWKRIKKAEERDVEEASTSNKGRSFLDDVQKSVYGTAKGGSSTIEESVRRRTHYSQGRSEASEGNAFRR